MTTMKQNEHCNLTGVVKEQVIAMIAPTSKYSQILNVILVSVDVRATHGIMETVKSIIHKKKRGTFT